MTGRGKRGLSDKRSSLFLINFESQIVLLVRALKKSFETNETSKEFSTFSNDRGYKTSFEVISTFRENSKATTHIPGNTKGGSITVPLTSCLTDLESAVRQQTIFVFIFKTD